MPKAAIHKPLEKLVPEMSAQEMDLLKKLLKFDPKERENADDYLNHPYFDEIRNIIELEIQELAELDLKE